MIGTTRTRISVKLGAAVLALLPLPALADVTARYTSGKDVVLVEADDGGNSRLTIADKGAIIHRDGVDYLVAMTPQGGARVTDLKAFIAVFSSVLVDQKAPKAGVNEMQFALTTKGETIVAGRTGAAFAFGPVQSAKSGRQEKQIEAVFTSDPALAPIGAVFRRTLESALPVLGIALPESSGFARLATELAAKGTPLRLAPMIEFLSADDAKIDAKRFELPAPVLTAAEFMTALNSLSESAELAPLP